MESPFIPHHRSAGACRLDTGPLEPGRHRDRNFSGVTEYVVEAVANGGLAQRNPPFARDKGAGYAFGQPAL
jgi:hypothetical protein